MLQEVFEWQLKEFERDITDQKLIIKLCKDIVRNGDNKLVEGWREKISGTERRRAVTEKGWGRLRYPVEKMEVVREWKAKERDRERFREMAEMVAEMAV